jgi:hypothetical protein
LAISLAIALFPFEAEDFFDEVGRFKGGGEAVLGVGAVDGDCGIRLDRANSGDLGSGTAAVGALSELLDPELDPPINASCSFLSSSARSSASDGNPSSSKASLARRITSCCSPYVYFQLAILTLEY